MKCRTCGGAGWQLDAPPPGEPAGATLECPTCEGIGEVSILGIAPDHVWLAHGSGTSLIYPAIKLSTGEFTRIDTGPPQVLTWTLIRFDEEAVEKFGEEAIQQWRKYAEEQAQAMPMKTFKGRRKPEPPHRITVAERILNGIDDD